MIATSLILVFIGVLVGIVGAVLGLGGGIIIVPVLVIGLDIPVHEAIAASLVIITANSLASSSIYIKNGLANMHFGMVIAIGASIGAIIGSYTAILISQAAGLLTLGSMQIITAIMTYVKTRAAKQYISVEKGQEGFFGGSYVDAATGKTVTYKPIRIWCNTFFGVLSGIFSGITGAGGGALIVPGMNLISYMPMKVSTATSMFVMGFTTAAGSLVYISAGLVNPFIVCSVILGIYFGTAISMKFFSRITDKKVSYLFIALLLTVACQMIYRGINLL